MTLTANVSYQSVVLLRSVQGDRAAGLCAAELAGAWLSPDRRYNLSVFCDNCTNETYITSVTEDYPEAFLTHYAEPRTVGVELKVHL